MQDPEFNPQYHQKKKKERERKYIYYSFSVLNTFSCHYLKHFSSVPYVQININSFHLIKVLAPGVQVSKD
jgi:hypothetical protein